MQETGIAIGHDEQLSYLKVDIAPLGPLRPLMHQPQRINLLLGPISMRGDGSSAPEIR